ncbi:hypothetical protein COJ85_06820 [Bacillus sp. AFS076308]|uniref:DUF4405 domain-containing protein n=1 Tax=unclassified Bacillus (in: firmicutes) TaxID=185979 RepID=UPI000BF84D6E|nr:MULTISPECIES: DUF4405 domain-containing protein [unclassified Bacillus (in: firmicutes)]PFO06613.1 hypothetical protein COJ85_06820 [Bacillus sp. AFS076308]PGV52834.1 hypothetical protein COD92_09105 [Bacillus sp. AFS037270]
MNRKMLFKLVNDVVMTVLMLIAMAYYITGNKIHELVGVVVLLLFIVHNLLNGRWYKVILKGSHHLRRKLQIVMNLLFLVTMAVMMISAVLISSDLFPHIPINNDMMLRQLHVQTAYWGFIIMAVHVGFSWIMIINSVRRMTGITGTSRIRTMGLRILAVLIVAYGVHASFKREMGSKLFIYNPFGNWFNENSTVVFLVDHLSIMGIYICGTHYALKFIQKQETRAEQTI